MAGISCKECQQWVYNLKTGERETYQAGSPDNVLPVKRTGPPPCKLGEKCPKGSPDQERDFELTERNWKMWMAYREHQAAGADPQNPADEVRRHMFALIHNVYRVWEVSETSRRIANTIGGMFAS